MRKVCRLPRYTRHHVDYLVDQMSFIDDKADANLKLLEIVPASDDYRVKLMKELDNRKTLASDADRLKSLGDEIIKRGNVLQARSKASPTDAFRWLQEMQGLEVQVDSFTKSMLASTS